MPCEQLPAVERPRHRASVIGLATLIFATAVCGAAEAADPATSPRGEQRLEPCTLLEVTDIDAVVGRSVNEGIPTAAGLESNGAYSSSCMWPMRAEGAAAEERDAPRGKHGFVILNVMQWPRGSTGADSYLQTFRDAARSGDIPHTPIARNFGDEALWWGDGLAVRRREVSFGISVFLPDHKDRNTDGQMEQALAPGVLRRLQELESGPGKRTDSK